MNFFSQAAKAVYAFVAAGLGSLITDLLPDKTIGDVTTAQWCGIALVAVLAAGGVYHIANGPAPAAKPPTS